MKKCIFSLALMVLMAIGMLAQDNKVKVSVNVGPQWNSYTGFTAGADVAIPLGRWRFEPGVYWSYRNRAYEQTENDVKEEYCDRLHYINIPLRLAAQLAGQADGPFSISVVFGPYISYGLGGKTLYYITKDGETSKTKTDAFGDEGDVKSRLDYGLNAGLNVVVKQHLKVGLFTEIGLKDIYRQHSILEQLLGDMTGITKVNLGAGITMGYQF